MRRASETERLGRVFARDVCCQELSRGVAHRMIHECLEHGAQYACLAANINFNLEGLRIGFWQLTIDGLSWGAIYELVEVGYTPVFGVLRVMNFGQSGLFTLGARRVAFDLDIGLCCYVSHT